MTDPRPLGTKAEVLVEAAAKALEQNANTLFDVSVAIFGKDYKTAMGLLKSISSQNLTALKVLNFLAAGEFGKAEQAVMDAKIAEKKGSGAK